MGWFGELGPFSLVLIACLTFDDLKKKSIHSPSVTSVNLYLIAEINLKGFSLDESYLMITLWLCVYFILEYTRHRNRVLLISFVNCQLNYAAWGWGCTLPISRTFQTAGKCNIWDGIVKKIWKPSQPSWIQSSLRWDSRIEQWILTDLSILFFT